MTKAEELAVLDTAIQALGPASYLGPWLSGVRAEVVRDLAADFVPAIWPSAALERARVIIEAAEARAVELTDRAAVDAERLRAEAAKDAGRMRGDAVAALRGALSCLGVR